VVHGHDAIIIVFKDRRQPWVCVHHGRRALGQAELGGRRGHHKHVASLDGQKQHLLLPLLPLAQGRMTCEGDSRGGARGEEETSAAAVHLGGWRLRVFGVSRGREMFGEEGRTEEAIN
jgi:hypothetical protein